MVGSPAGKSVARKVGQKGRRKSWLEIFFGSQGDLMAVEDSDDEGGVVRVRYDH